MKSLIVFYSLEGNTKSVAEAISGLIGADVLELKPQNDIPSTGFMRYCFGGKQVLFGDVVKLESCADCPDDYDFVFIGTPVWAFSCTPAVRTFLQTRKFVNKQMALFCCFNCLAGKTFYDMEKLLLGNSVISKQGFRMPIDVSSDVFTDKIKKWLNSLPFEV